MDWFSADKAGDGNSKEVDWEEDRDVLNWIEKQVRRDAGYSFRCQSCP